MLISSTTSVTRGLFTGTAMMAYTSLRRYVPVLIPDVFMLPTSFRRHGLKKGSIKGISLYANLRSS
jgi:hypothetical protein